MTRAAQIVQAAERFSAAKLTSEYCREYDNLRAAVALPPDEREVCFTNAVEAAAKAHFEHIVVGAKWADAHPPQQEAIRKDMRPVVAAIDSSKDAELARLTAALREREADSARFLWMQENHRRCFTDDGLWMVHHPSGDSRRARSFFAGPFDSLTEAVDYARDESRVFDYAARTTEGA